MLPQHHDGSDSTTCGHEAQQRRPQQRPANAAVPRYRMGLPMARSISTAAV